VKRNVLVCVDDCCTNGIIDGRFHRDENEKKRVFIFWWKPRGGLRERRETVFQKKQLFSHRPFCARQREWEKRRATKRTDEYATKSKH
jgi:hypothetical protein